MPKPAVDFDTYLKRIPAHSVALRQESRVPWRHYQRSSSDAWNLLVYIERNLAEVSTYAVPLERHIHHLSTMVLLGLVEAFERFLKELAAACINHVAKCVLDDRLDVFSVKGNVVAAHFSEGNLGKALCEPLTWCDCEETGQRFRRILADPFKPGNFYIFPLPTQNPVVLRNRHDLMCIVWQLRHTIAHNMGVITPSDALKFRLLVKETVESPRLLWPSRGDVWYVKLFLEETAELVNREVVARLAQLLTTFHAADASLFNPIQKAQELADLFGLPCTVAGETRNPA